MSSKPETEHGNAEPLFLFFCGEAGDAKAEALRKYHAD